MPQLVFKSNAAGVFSQDPDGLGRTTHLAIGAHPDDNEMMAYSGISACYASRVFKFTSVVLTDGAGGTRGGAYKGMSDADLKLIRRLELEKAANIGRFHALISLGYASEDVKATRRKDVKDDLVQILMQTIPRVVYIHSLFDDHDTHVASSLRSIEALRELRDVFVPEHVYGCEVTGSLDWYPEKVRLDDSLYPDVASGVLNVFVSQAENGRSYPEATLARRRSNAVFDRSNKRGPRSITYAMDLRQLIDDPQIPIAGFMQGEIDKHRARKMQDISLLL